MPCTSLETDSRAPLRARQYVRSLLADAPEELRARACQVVTELVTNSVRYAGGGSITVDARLDEREHLSLEVRDEGPGFDAQPRAAGHAEITGWGLLFVDMLTESWACGGPGAPIVWAHLEPRSMDADEESSTDPILDARLRDLLD